MSTAGCAIPTGQGGKYHTGCVKTIPQLYALRALGEDMFPTWRLKMKESEKISDEQLMALVDFAEIALREEPGPVNCCRLMALQELQERRRADNANRQKAS